MKALTVFTPTYNRANTLPRLYHSLLNQDRDCFKWLIVDDGSQDNTRELVTQWINEALIEIKYIYQENAGKMQAHNRGVLECDTDLFLCCDSDDWMMENSIKKSLDYWENHKHEDLAGMISPKKIVNGTVDNLSLFPKNEDYDNLTGIYNKGYIGETAIFFRIEIVKNFLFPKIEGEKFIPESYVYQQIDQSYMYLLCCSYFMECEYQPDGLSNNGYLLGIRNPRGMAMAANMSLSMLPFLKCFRAAGSLDFYSIICGQSLIDILKVANKPLICLLMYPLAFVKYLTSRNLIQSQNTKKKL